MSWCHWRIYVVPESNHIHWVRIEKGDSPTPNFSAVDDLYSYIYFCIILNTSHEKMFSLTSSFDCQGCNLGAVMC